MPFEESVGYQVRATHRVLQRYLQLKIEPYGVTLGMWYFLRALWDEDGLTQRELSRRVGTTEPTTLTALLSMERSGLIRRLQSSEDRRRMHVFLTSKGRNLKAKLMPLARSVVATAVQGFSAPEARALLAALVGVQRNIQTSLSQFDESRLV
ncbi:MAG: MarR family winged helix-turn-helix transcriptional regulator [Pseudorhodoplanes sp.]|uniref:MarR family winged helix-turn-helix transcriptional regulator n=1 Tax=Pseudorhodoplanes sp. TaxID=1934341 RepID=UPI003D12F128